MAVNFRIVVQVGNPLVALKKEGTMDRKKFIAHHRYYNEYSKKAIWEGAAIYEEGNRE